MVVFSQLYLPTTPEEELKPTTAPTPKRPPGEFRIQTDKQTYLVGETVTLEVENIGPTALTFPDSSLGLKILMLPSRQLVYSPIALQVVTELQPGERKVFTWTQVDINERQVPPGDYAAEAATLGRELVAETVFTIEPPPKAKDEVSGEAKAPASLKLRKVYGELDFPVSIAFTQDGRIFFNERTTGRIRIISDGKLLPEPFATLEVETVGETGLLGLALHPDFADHPYVYVYYTQRGEDGSLRNRVARFTAHGNVGGNFTVLLDDIPAASFHNGGVLAFGPDGNLYVTTGDATRRKLAQDPTSMAGKVLRITPDGAIPEDNPFPGSPVFSIGHRNVFGIAFHPLTGKAYITENGPATDDEINILEAGGNYGWPQALGATGGGKFTQPILTLTPVVAPTAIVFYEGDKLPEKFRHNLFFADWNTGSIRRVVLEPPKFERVQDLEVVAVSDGGGILDLELAPDGFLYATTPTGIYRLELETRS